MLSLVLSLVLCVQCKALETVVSVMEKLESELAIRSSNVQNFKVDVTDPSVLTRLKGECGSVGTCVLITVGNRSSLRVQTSLREVVLLKRFAILLTSWMTIATHLSWTYRKGWT